MRSFDVDVGASASEEVRGVLLLLLLVLVPVLVLPSARSGRRRRGEEDWRRECLSIVLFCVLVIFEE